MIYIVIASFFFCLMQISISFFWSLSSRDWMSEVERIFVRNTKRKVSGGDFAGSSSPLITESAPNSPASTHYGLASRPFVLIMRVLFLLLLFVSHVYMLRDCGMKYICTINARIESTSTTTMST